LIDWVVIVKDKIDIGLLLLRIKLIF